MGAAAPTAPPPYHRVHNHIHHHTHHHTHHQHDPTIMPPPPLDPTLPASTATAVSRSMSRYRRQRPSITARPVAPNSASPPLPVQMQHVPILPATSALTREEPGPPAASDPIDGYPAGSLARAREEARRALEGETQRQTRVKAQLKAEKRAKVEEAERRAQQCDARGPRPSVEQSRRPQETGDGLYTTTHPPPRSDSPPSARRKDRLVSLLHRRRDDRQHVVPVASSGSDNTDDYNIKAGGRGIVPGIDAPVSAVNAGDRRVKVEYNGKQTLLPVTPITTPQELIRAASTVVSDKASASTSVLLEFFTKAGVQRPLRNYEHVRDVLNSWDDDLQNTLILVDSPTGGNDVELTAGSVPSERPAGYSCWMQYSQKPGRWSKKYVTLRNDGQVLLARNEGGKDSANVCHLSDFDIYSPSAETKARKVKPPKRYCFAIKSQQKSTMFVSTSSFVHFFCSSDKIVAADFYSSIQGWRSWYLVNVLGEGQKTAKADQPQANGGPAPHQVSSRQPGPFRPLIDAGNIDSLSLAPAPKVASSVTDVQPGLVKVSRDRPQLVQTCTSSNMKSSSATVAQQLPSEADDSTFAANGLLGHGYSQRQQQAADREKNLKSSGPFVEGPSLLNSVETTHPRGNPATSDSCRPRRMSSVRSSRGRESGEIQRTASVRRAMPKPLVDLTPQYREPPQFAKKGKGYRPDQIGPGGLVDAATSPDVPIAIPPSQDWRARRDPGTSRPDVPSDPDRTRSLRGHALRTNHFPSNVLDNGGPEAFTGRGLLASAPFGPTASTAPSGHGVMDGSRARGPLIDLGEDNHFQPGSLLDRVAARKPSVSIADRERRRSIDVSAGSRS